MGQETSMLDARIPTREASIFHNYDVLREIVGWLDTSTLRTVNVLNRASNHFTDHRLWRSVTIDASRAGCPVDASPAQRRITIHNVCSAVRKRYRANSIRILRFSASYEELFAEPSEEHALEHLFQDVSSTFRACTKLQSLCIRICHHREEFAVRLSADAVDSRRQFPFQLIHLETSATIGDGLLPFVTKQLALKHYSEYSLRNISPPIQPQRVYLLESGAMPLIHTLHTKAKQAKYMLPHCPVRSLELTDIGFKKLAKLRVIPESYPEVIHLAFNAVDNGNTLDQKLTEALHVFHEKFPGIASLRICTHPQYWPTESVGRALGMFHNLQFISWMAIETFPPVFNNPAPTRPPDVPEHCEENEWELMFLELVSELMPTVFTVEITRQDISSTTWHLRTVPVNEDANDGVIWDLDHEAYDMCGPVPDFVLVREVEYDDGNEWEGQYVYG